MCKKKALTGPAFLEMSGFRVNQELRIPNWCRLLFMLAMNMSIAFLMRLNYGRCSLLAVQCRPNRNLFTMLSSVSFSSRGVPFSTAKTYQPAPCGMAHLAASISV